jgi:hypothetical protein
VSWRPGALKVGGGKSRSKRQVDVAGICGCSCGMFYL